MRACLPPTCLLPPSLIRSSACPVHFPRCSLISCSRLSGRLEIEHCRAFMFGFLHVIALKAGIVMLYDLSTVPDLTFSDACRSAASPRLRPAARR